MGDIHSEFTGLVSEFMKQLEHTSPRLSIEQQYERMEAMKDYLFGCETLPADFPHELGNITAILKNFVEELNLIFTDKMNEIFEENRPVRVQAGGRRRTHHRSRRASHRRARRQTRRR